MKVFITGGTGFIGSHLINEIHSKNIEIISTKRESSKPRIALMKEPTWINEGDLNELSHALKKCDIFINCAASGVSPQKCSWSDLIDYNIKKTLALFSLAKKAGLRNYIFLGSDMEVNPYTLLVRKNEKLNPYSAIKTAAFHLIYSYSLINNLNMKYIKLPNIYGEGQYSENLWPSLKHAALSGNNYKILNSNTVKNFLSVQKATEIIAENLIFNIRKEGLLEIIKIKGEKRKVGEFAKNHWFKWKAEGKLTYKG
jgi:nucleoside-diphosphate-sugar epimerase